MANEVKATITVDTKQAEKAINEVTNDMLTFGKQAEKSVEKADKSVSGFTGSVSKMGTSLKVAGGIMIAEFAGRALGAVRDGFLATIAASQRQEDAINSLNAALRSSGQFSEAASEDFQRFAASLQEVTRFGDEAILEQIAFAKSMGATNDQIKKLLPAALDMSAALNMDLNAAVRNIVKTLGGLKGELGESIVELGALSAEQLKAGQAIDLISDKFRGQAAAAAGTFSGRIEQLTNAWGDLLETAGDFVTKSELVNSAISLLTKGVVALNDAIGTDEVTIESLTEKLQTQKKAYEDLSIASQQTGNRFTNIAEKAEAARMAMLETEGQIERMRLAQKAADEQAVSATVETDPAADPRVLKEMAVQAEIQRLQSEADLVELERQVLKKEIKFENTEQELEALRQIEQSKLEINQEAELEKSMLIQDAEDRNLKIKELAAKRNLENAKLQAKQEVEIEKNKEQQKKMVQQIALQSAANFLQAGISLTKESSAAQKALLSAQAIMNTYVAANNALATPAPYPLPAIFAASTIALGLANVAKINGQSFATGGVVGGFGGATMGGDNTIANVRTGEMVLNASQQRNLFDIANNESGQDSTMERMVESVQMMASSPIIVSIDNKEVARAVRSARQDGFVA